MDVKSATVAVGVVLGLSLVLSGTTSAHLSEFAKRPAGRPHGKSHVYSSKSSLQYPDQGYSIPLAYYSLRGNFNTRITLNNKGIRELTPQITLYDRDGHRFALPPTTVAPHSFVDVDLRPYADEAGVSFADGSAKVTYVGKPMELGGLLRMIDATFGLELDDNLMYPNMTPSNRLEGVWSLPNNGVPTRLIVTNTTAETVSATVTMRGTPRRAPQTVELGPWKLTVLDIGGPGSRQNGGVSISYSGRPGGVVARAYALHPPTGYSAAFPINDPARLKTSGYFGAGVRVDDRQGHPLEPAIVAMNTASTAATLRALLLVTHDGQLDRIDVATVVIAPGDVIELPARRAWQDASRLGMMPAAGLQISYDTGPGTVIVWAAAMSPDSSEVFRVPLVDAATEPSATGDYFWSTETGNDSIVSILNTTDGPQRFHLEVRFQGGSWSRGLQTIEAGQSAKVDVGELQSEHITDAKGRTIPSNVTRGQIHWSQVSGKSRTALLGRVEQENRSQGINSTYACPLSENDRFGEAWLEPNPDFDVLEIGIDDSDAFVALERDFDALDSHSGDPYDITGDLDWYSWAPGVAQSLGGGEFRGVSDGSASVSAQGYAQAPPDGNPYGVHDWLDLPGEALVECSEPKSFKSITEYTININHDLHVEVLYTWDPTHGKRSSLSQCSINEIIEYPTYPWPYPFRMTSGVEQGPKEIIGTNGASNLLDTQKPGDLPFTSPLTTVSFDAKQTFGYRCGCTTPTDEWRVLQPEFNITREIITPNGYAYKVSKPKPQGGTLTKTMLLGVLPNLLVGDPRGLVQIGDRPRR